MNTNKQFLSAMSDFIGNETLCPDSENMLAIFPALIKLQNDKGNYYGRSWCRHGDLSAFFNLERKWDRIYNIMDRAMNETGTQALFTSDETGTATETLLDTIADLGIYAFMWVGFIRERYPDAWQKFIEANQL